MEPREFMHPSFSGSATTPYPGIKRPELDEEGRRWLTNFTNGRLELYQYAIVGFDAVIKPTDQKILGEKVWELWTDTGQQGMFWARFQEMRARQEQGEKYWMLVDNDKFPTKL